MGRLLTIVGLITTFLYSISIFWLTSGRWGQIMTMRLNELGDFLAGVFGPLALFWLILGFLQQGKELQQNSHSLETQTKELNRLIRKQLIEISQTQRAVELQAILHTQDHLNDEPEHTADSIEKSAQEQQSILKSFKKFS